MEKLPMCRICLVEDVRMYVVVNKNLHELYEELTEVPFITEDNRPLLACSFCCAKLKQCWRFQRKCLEAEELFTQMMNEDYEHDPLISQGKLSFCNGLMKAPVENINIVGACQTESCVIKEKLPDVSEHLDDIIEPKEEHQIIKYESELDNVENSYPDVEATAALHAESDSDDAPLLEIKSEVEVEPESIGAPVAKKPKLDTRRSTLGDTIPVDQTKASISKYNDAHPKLMRVSEIENKSQNHTNNHEVRISSINDTALGTSSCNNGNNCKISNKGIVSDDITGVKDKCYNYCSFCQRSFDLKDKFIRHNMITHSDERRFICDICQRSFKKRTILINHIRSHNDEKSFKCDKCRSSFKRKYDLTTHIRLHQDEKAYKCNTCQRGFNRSLYLNKHMRVHTGEKPYKCDVCQRSFSQKIYLTNHNRIHTGEKPFKCDLCQRSFSEKSNLTKHNLIHTGEKPFKCVICQLSFNRKSTLTQHNRTHTGEKPFKCDVCQRSFRQNGDLITHNRTHTGEKPFKCDVCLRSFVTKGDLIKHNRTHTGEKPFKCGICQRSFRAKGDLTIHNRTHTGEKPFKCDTCQHSFSQKYHLTEHNRIHTGEKPFKCDVCHLSFRTKGVLNKHTCKNH